LARNVREQGVLRLIKVKYHAKVCMGRSMANEKKIEPGGIRVKVRMDERSR
jgi:hypothetical protein